MVCLLWRNGWILETQPSVWTNPKLNMLKTYGLHHFFLNLFHFLRFEVIPHRIVIHILSFCCFFLALIGSCCRSFLICLPVYTPCCWAQSHWRNCPKSCFDHITPLPKGWHQRQSTCSLAPAGHPSTTSFLLSTTLPAVWTSHHSLLFLSLWILTPMMPCGKNIHSSHLISLSKPFLSFVALLLIRYAFLITVAGSEVFFLYAFLSVAWSSQLVLTTDGFVFSHPSFLVSFHFDFKQWEARFLAYTFVSHPRPRGRQGMGERTTDSRVKTPGF